MEKLLEIISSPIWWVTVVVAGIIINLVSSYLRDLLDVRVSKVSTWWRRRSEEAKRKEQEYIEKLRGDDSFSTLHTIRYMEMRTWCIVWMLLGVMCFLSAVITKKSTHGPEIVFMALGAIAFFRAFQHLNNSNKFANYAESAFDPEDT